MSPEARQDNVARPEREDFFEEDEPLEDVLAAFGAGTPCVTMPPPGWTGPVLDGSTW